MPHHEAETKERSDAAPLSAFHQLRISFNSAFLREDINAALAACRQAMELSGLEAHERRELARFLQMLGRIPEAVKQLRQLLAENPADHESALRLALILRLGHDEAEYLGFIDQRLAENPSQTDLYLDKLLFLKDYPDPDMETQLRIKARENGIELPETDNPVSAISDLDLAPGGESLFRESDLLAMLDIFKGRENCFARQWVSDDGKTGYVPVQEPLNIQHLRNHLLGTQTLGVYQLDLENKVKWVMFDLDVEKSHLNDLNDRDFKEWLDAGMRKVVDGMTTLLKGYHIQANLEFSGYKGYHLWILLKEKISANHARNFAQRIAAQVNLANLPINLEIFPKQTKVFSNSYGNLVKLPYGTHRVSGLPSSMLDSEGNLIPFADFVQAANLVDAEEFINALSSLDPGYQLGAANSIPDLQEPVRQQSEASEPILDPDTDPEWLCLKQHCHALWTIDNLIRTGGVLDPGQKIVLRHSCGHLRNGPAIVNTLMRRLHDHSPDDLLRSGFKGNAISCPKIRTYMKESIIPEMCSCVFPPEMGMYDNPLLHLHKLDTGKNAAPAWNDAKLKDLISTYLKLRLDEKELGKRLRNTEKEILDAFEAIGVKEFETPWGKLRKDSDDTGEHLILNLT